MATDDATSIAFLLDAAHRDLASAPELLAQVYGQLRALARGYLRKEHTLQATAIVHEAYIRLVGSGDVNWESPGQFFAAAAAAMRSVLIDHARARSRLKRGGDRRRVDLTDAVGGLPDDPAEFFKMDEAIRRLELVQTELAQVVHLKFFVGFDIAETAQALGVSTPTVKRRWQLARAWLYRELEPGKRSDERN